MCSFLDQHGFDAPGLGRTRLCHFVFLETAPKDQWFHTLIHRGIPGVLFRQSPAGSRPDNMDRDKGANRCGVPSLQVSQFAWSDQVFA
jgi:hypothetical protein